jgi:tartrate-resistant acid phosphatase type 5
MEEDREALTDVEKDGRTSLLNPDIYGLPLSRRRFLRQTIAFSALAALGASAGMAAPSTAEDAASELLMVGDWGYDKHEAGQQAVAVGMRRYAQEQHVRTRALLMLGDNWYGALDGGAHSARWQTQFEQMYPVDAFNCPAYAVLGNHDYQHWPESKVDAELEYARLGKTRWTMPGRWYRFEFPTEKPLITFLALDSNMPFTDGETTHGVNFTLTPEQHAQQLTWFETELKRARSTPFLAVIAHHPVYSDGPHGDHPVLIRDWDPLFRKYKVDLYLAGHDHDLQHLEFDGHPTSFFLSGGGGADLYNLKIDPKNRGPYGEKIYGFSHLRATAKQMTLRHLDSDGRLLHGFSKTADGHIALLQS